ncbi:unnamed protein product [Phytophthora fragariaefolia]|uniref:Unnamed protein product n=1 Tax=Phytophthora fragariaefolia TaxID=1490495 RepID=A0A9W6XQE6_9STRA|nr:unnamed protein product [Phytophthora fragariaefolia]
MCGTSRTSSTNEEISDSNDSDATDNGPSNHGAVARNDVEVSSPIELGEAENSELKSCCHAFYYRRSAVYVSAMKHETTIPFNHINTTWCILKELKRKERAAALSMGIEFFGGDRQSCQFAGRETNDTMLKNSPTPLRKELCISTEITVRAYQHLPYATCQHTFTAPTFRDELAQFQSPTATNRILRKLNDISSTYTAQSSKLRYSKSSVKKLAHTPENNTRRPSESCQTSGRFYRVWVPTVSIGVYVR